MFHTYFGWSPDFVLHYVQNYARQASKIKEPARPKLERSEERRWEESPNFLQHLLENMVVGNTHLQYREIFERDSATETILIPIMSGPKVKSV